jgi:type I restriction enzyme S subunit
MRWIMQIGELVREGVISIKTGPFGTQLKAAEYQKSGTPVLNVKNLGYGSVSKAKLDHVGSETVDRLRTHLLKKGDIVFGRKGAVDRHAYIDYESDGWMQGSDCIRMRIESNTINPRFLSYYFLTNKHKAFMISMCSHGTTMASLNQKILEQIEIPYPERQYQDKVVDMLERFDKKIKVNSEINENLAA